MKAFINIPKRVGSCNTTRNAALSDAVKATTLRGLSNAWKLETTAPWAEIDCMRATKLLKQRLADACDELRARPHSTFAELHDAGVFGGLEVLERRGFWRVEYEIPEVFHNEAQIEREAKLARQSADNHSNFGTY